MSGKVKLFFSFFIRFKRNYFFNLDNDFEELETIIKL